MPTPGLAIVAEPDSWVLARFTPPLTEKAMAYTTLFLDSQVVQMEYRQSNPCLYNGEEVDPIISRGLMCMYQPGHNHTSYG